MRRLTILATSLLAFVAACEGPAASSAAEGAPVRTGAANAKFLKPAFEGQTRAPERRTAVKLKTETFASGLEEPWGLAFLPDGGVLVTEQLGRLRLVSAQGQVSPPIEGVPAVDNRNQGGLLDVTLSPTFSEDRLIYFTYAEPRGGDKNGTAVAKARLSEDSRRLENLAVIFRQLPDYASEGHFGGAILFAPDGALFVTLGERYDARDQAQDLGGHLGKVIRIKPDGAAPTDNPFATQAGARAEIWSYGHRNPQGAAIHPETGALWTIEHGPRGGDELNRIEPGKNYGWPVITYGIEYSGDKIGEGISARDGMEQPVYYWDPVIAPGGMSFYTGEMFPEWRGDLLIGALSGAVVRLDLEGGRVTGEERMLRDVGRVRDVMQGPDGALWLITDEPEGRILRVTRAT